MKTMTEKKDIRGVAGSPSPSGLVSRGFMAALLFVLTVALAGCAGRDGRHGAVREPEAVQGTAEASGMEPAADSVASAPARTLPDSVGFALDRMEHDFGQVALGAAVSATFRLGAQGGPVVVLSAKTNCECTRAEYPGRPLQDGESAQVKVLFEAKTRGVFYKTVHLRLHAGGRERTAELRVRGTVE